MNFGCLGRNGFSIIFIANHYFEVQRDRQHLLVESSLQACRFVLDERPTAFPCTSQSSSLNLTSAQVLLKKRRLRRPRTHAGSRQSFDLSVGTMAAAAESHVASPRMARQRHSALGLAKALLAIIALSLSQCCQLQGLGIVSRSYEESESLASCPFAKGAEEDGCFRSFGVPVASRSSWISHGLPGAGGSHDCANILMIQGFRGQKSAIHRAAMMHAQEMGEKQRKSGKEAEYILRT